MRLISAVVWAANSAWVRLPWKMKSRYREILAASALAMAEASVKAVRLFWALEISCRSFVNVIGGELIVELDAS
jgi:hypothetical protein